MQALAKHKFARSSAQKTRLVADQIRGLAVGKALDVLTYSPKKAAELVKKVLLSAIANAEHNEGADIDTLKVKTVFVDEGPSMKRIKPRAKGRADRIVKRTSHITVIVADCSVVRFVIGRVLEFTILRGACECIEGFRLK